MSQANMPFCQSCGMPLETKALHGSNADGTISDDYCTYCYKEGRFTSETTMDEMIEFCIPHVSNNNPYPNAEAARAAMQQYFPQLKRWAKQ